MAAGTSIRLVIPSEVKLIDLVHTATEKMAELAGFDSDEALNVGLAVREAAINAIVHGNKQNPELDVHVTLSFGKEGLKARIVDHGNGFDPDSTPDPREGDNLLRSSGRGLLLIRAFVDEVEFKRGRDGGTEITLIKRNDTKKDQKKDKSTS